MVAKRATVKAMKVAMKAKKVSLKACSGLTKGKTVTAMKVTKAKGVLRLVPKLSPGGKVLVHKATSSHLLGKFINRQMNSRLPASQAKEKAKASALKQKERLKAAALKDKLLREKEKAKAAALKEKEKAKAAALKLKADARKKREEERELARAEQQKRKAEDLEAKEMAEAIALVEKFEVQEAAKRAKLESGTETVAADISDTEKDAASLEQAQEKKAEMPDGPEQKNDKDSEDLAEAANDVSVDEDHIRSESIDQKSDDKGEIATGIAMVEADAIKNMWQKRAEIFQNSIKQAVTEVDHDRQHDGGAEDKV